MPRRKKVNCVSGGSLGGSSHRSLPSINSREKPQQRNAANARERARMRVLSRAFCRLKTTLPWVPADTKLSKLDTLRLASHYISHLKGILEDDLYKSDESLHPAMSLTWPFGFNRLGVNGNGSGEGISDVEEEDENGGNGGRNNGGMSGGDRDSCCGSSDSISWEDINSGLTQVDKTDGKDVATDRIHLVVPPLHISTNPNKSFMTHSNPIYDHPISHHHFHDNNGLIMNIMSTYT